MASRAVNREIRHGRLKPPTDFSCSDCGKKAAVYDHRNYQKPLDVVPVCVRCNHLRGPAIRS